jgi:hypothetical protein
MRGKGINYDTGFLRAGGSTHEPFDPDVVRREMGIIHDDLHCNAVRITGGDLDRLKIAASHAADAGLEVWLSPFTTDLTTDRLLAFLAECAAHAERLRVQGAEVVLATGSELSLFNKRFVPGETLDERLGLLEDLPRLRAALPHVPGRINDFSGKAVPVVRERFGGKVTYASIPFEGVDWTPFDIVATDAGYRPAKVADRYRDGVRSLVALGKPVAITEVGCTTHAGAADLGGDANLMVEWGDDGSPRRLRGEYVRDETGQAACILGRGGRRRGVRVHVRPVRPAPPSRHARGLRRG